MMIDFNVIMDKLNSLETADEIAGFLQDQGAQGRVNNVRECVVSRYVQQVTGIRHVRTGAKYTRFYVPLTGLSFSKQHWYQQPDDENRQEHSEALTEFIKKFDREQYPDLVNEAKYNPLNKL